MIKIIQHPLIRQESSGKICSYFLVERTLEVILCKEYSPEIQKNKLHLLDCPSAEFKKVHYISSFSKMCYPKLLKISEHICFVEVPGFSGR